MPIAMVQELDKMSPADLAIYFFSAMNIPYTPEWEEIYYAMLDFTYHMYKCRAKLQ